MPDLPAAACAGQDPEAWFSPDPWTTARAVAVCRRCPVRAACLAWALTHRERHGVWGGLTAWQRACHTRPLR